MTHVVRSIIASFIAVPFFVGAAEAQGKDLSIDFRMTESGISGGKAVNGSSTGRAVLSGDRVRYDMTGNTRAMAMPGMAQTDSMSIIMLDSGKTFMHMLTADRSLFDVPAGYTQITMPSTPTMPPRRKPTPSTKSG